MMTSVRLTLFLLLSVLSAASARAQNAVVLDSYTCAQFLEDTKAPAGGAQLLRSMMMIAWASGYAAAHQTGTPRGDPKAVQIVAATIGDACRKDAGKRALAAIVDTVAKLASPKAADIAKTLGPLTAGVSRWEQNGSIVYLTADGPVRKYYYELAIGDLAPAGINKGTLFFDGKKSGTHYEGTAYSFAPKCKPQGFAVTGDISDDEKQVTLRGKKPLLSPACKITGYSDEPLVLTFVPPEGK